MVGLLDRVVETTFWVSAHFQVFSGHVLVDSRESQTGLLDSHYQEVGPILASIFGFLGPVNFGKCPRLLVPSWKAMEYFKRFSIL